MCIVPITDARASTASGASDLLIFLHVYKNMNELAIWKRSGCKVLMVMDSRLHPANHRANPHVKDLLRQLMHTLTFTSALSEIRL